MSDTRGESSRLRINTTWPPRGRARRTALGLATVTAVAGTIMVLSAASGAGPANAEAEKYFVCKYVGTPGVDERLQTGQNPISVAAAAIPETPVVVGSFFSDDQGRSFVLVADTGQPEPPVSDCPPPDTGGTETPPPSSETPPPSSETPPPSSETPPPSSETPPPSSETPPPSETVSTSPSFGISGAETSNVPPAATSAAPIPAGVSAGLHTPVANAALKAWGIALMLLGGAAGLLAGLWPTRRRAH